LLTEASSGLPVNCFGDKFSRPDPVEYGQIRSDSVNCMTPREPAMLKWRGPSVGVLSANDHLPRT